MNRELFDYQLEAINKLKKFKVGALFMEPGTGKTQTAVSLINSRKDIDRVIWFCPFQTKSNLKEELVKCNLNYPCEIIGIETLSNSDITYINLLNKYEKDTKCFAIVDESLKIKNNSNRTRRITDICKNMKYKLILNGTLISKNYLDLYYQMNFLSPKILKMSHQEFYNNFVIEKQVYRNHKRVRKYISGFDNLEYLFNLISPFIFKSELKLDIQVKEYNIEYDLDIQERLDEYYTFKNKLLDSLKSGEAFLCILQKMQHTYSYSLDKEYKFKKLLRKLSDKKVLIFCKYIDEQEWANSIVNNNNHKVLSLQKHSFGLNLQEYNNIIFLNKSWDYSLLEQAKRRIIRIGQDKECSIYYFNCNIGLEKMIINSLDKKSNLLLDLKNMVIERIEKIL